jgi:uncharacterized protein (UPF0332 family)/predicted nucleotidyltransferase
VTSDERAAVLDTPDVLSGGAAWQQATREYVERLRRHYGGRLAALVLYGSRARGQGDDESDVDLLVVLRDGYQWETEQAEVSRLTQDLEERFDYPLLSTLFVTERDYRSRMLPIYMNIRREGVVLWSRQAAKLIREEGGDYGRSVDQSADHVMRRAREALVDGQAGLEQGRLRWAVNRAYYAMFHAATALLLAEGLAYSKHRGVIGALNRHYIRTNRFPLQLGRDLRHAFDARNRADYAYEDDIPASETANLVRSAGAFVAAAEELLSKEQPS